MRKIPIGRRASRWGVVAAAGVLIAGTFAGAEAASAAAVVPQALPAGCSGTSPIYCHYGVARSNYDLTVSIGSSNSAASTAMSVEARRLMLPATGTVATYSFTINVRQPEGEPTGEGGYPCR